jgi:hypothetical protein
MMDPNGQAALLGLLITILAWVLLISGMVITNVGVN